MKIGIISGASSGIGKALARELDACGLDEIWLIGRNEERLCSLRDELESYARCFSLDLSSEQSCGEIKNMLEKGDFTIKYLVLSAGIGYTGKVESNSQSQISKMIDLNCKGLSLLTSISLPYMSFGGEIITIASGAGFLPQADFAVYAATKAYVISFSRALRKELKSKKINVCAVCPGPVDTEFFAGLENVKEYKKKYLISPNKVATGALKASRKRKAIFSPTISMKLLHLGTKILPTALLMKFAK